MLAMFKSSVSAEKTNQQKQLTFRDVNFSFEISQYRVVQNGWKFSVELRSGIVFLGEVMRSNLQIIMVAM